MENLGPPPKIAEARSAHRCKLPSYLALGRVDALPRDGDVLKCPECGQFWRCDNHILDDYVRVNERWLQKNRPDLAARPKRSWKVKWHRD